jgi:hypothetical protein
MSYASLRLPGIALHVLIDTLRATRNGRAEELKKRFVTPVQEAVFSYI